MKNGRPRTPIGGPTKPTDPFKKTISMNSLTILVLALAYTMLVLLWFHEYVGRLRAEIALMEERTMRRNDLERFNKALESHER
jgi:hypothetical protein